MTLRWRLTVAFSLVVLVPLLTGLLLVARALPRAVQDRQQTDVASSGRLVAQLLLDACLRAQTTAEAAGRFGTLADGAGARNAAQSFLAKGMADGIQVRRPAGPPLVSLGRLPQRPQDCLATRGSTEPFLAAVVHLSTPAGAPAGTAIAAVDVSKELLARATTALGSGDIALVSSAGQAVASSRSLDPGLVRALVAGRARDGVVASYLPAGPGQPFGVLVLVPSAQGSNLLVQGGLIIVLALLAAIGIAVVSARTTTRPLAELGDAATRIAGGDLSTTIAVRSAKDEVGRLAIAFNAMTDELRGYVGELQASHDELQSGLSRLGDTLSSTHDLDRILNVVLESAMAATRAKGGMLLLLSAEEEVLSVSASRGVNIPVDLQLKLGDGISGRVARSGAPLRGIIGTGRGELRSGAGEPKDTSVIAVPLKSAGAVIGVLDLFGSAKPGGFDDNDLATIQTFAGQATVAIDNVLLHEETQLLAITDALTGLPNYRHFAMTLAREIERSTRFDRPLALLMLDLDLFKGVNDTFGHQRGDAVLVEVAKRIQAKCRDVDTVCRYGGEEFVVILPETDAEGAVKLAERIGTAVRRKPFGPAGVPPVHLTVSIGIAVFPEHGTTTSLLLRRADDALYEVKAQGRNSCRLASVEG